MSGLDMSKSDMSKRDASNRDMPNRDMPNRDMSALRSADMSKRASGAAPAAPFHDRVA